MPCYHPRPARREYSKGKAHISLKTGGEPNIWLPCQTCIGCMEMKQQELALRLTHEAKAYEPHEKHFLTFTEDDDHYTSAGLDKREIQNLWKRVRQTIARNSSDTIHGTKLPIKYLQCGEYGDRTKRRHYHAAALGLVISDQKKWDAENNRSEALEKQWGRGIVTISELTQDRINYVAGYVLKKAGYKKQWYTTEPTKEEWGEWREILKPPFRDMSKGLGKEWIKKYASDLRNGYVQEDGNKYSIPRYYREYIKENNPKLDLYIQAKKQEAWKELTPEDRKLLHNGEKIRLKQIREMKSRDKV